MSSGGMQACTMHASISPASKAVSAVVASLMIRPANRSTFTASAPRHCFHFVSVIDSSCFWPVRR